MPKAGRIQIDDVFAGAAARVPVGGPEAADRVAGELLPDVAPIVSMASRWRW